MKFTPNNIRNQEFNRAVRGYDKEEVTAFLESLSFEFGQLLEENEKYKKKIEEYEEEMKEFKKLEKTLQSTLISAQESSNKAVESARKQNALIIKEAEIKATQIVEKAKQEADHIRKAVFKLKEERNLLIAKLKAVVETQTRVLDMRTDTIKSGGDEGRFKPVASDKSEIDVDDILEKLL